MTIEFADLPLPWKVLTLKDQVEKTPQSIGTRVFTPEQSRVIWLIWLTYGAFYFCRTNISVAAHGMGLPVSEGGLALTGEAIGMILASLKLTYGVGQLVNGQLTEHVSPRYLLAIGMFVSAGLNVLFGFSTGFYFLLFVWACNGYVQSMGWPPCMRITSDWIPVLLRGRAIGVIGTGYQVTAGLTYLVAGQSAEYFGWRAAFYVPAILMAAAAVVMLLFLKESPGDAAAIGESESSLKRPRSSGARIVENVLITLSNPALWLLGIALGLLNACRYGFLDWGVVHLIEIQGAGVGKSAFNFIILPLGGVAGSYAAGWASDQYFGGRRAPVISLLLVMLGLLTLVYDYVSRVSLLGTIVLLGVIGFCIFGPQVLLVGTAPADLARRGTAAAAAGFVNFMGYMGAATGDMVTGHYKMPEHGGWQVAVWIWSGWAFAAAAVSALLWKHTANRT